MKCRLLTFSSFILFDANAADARPRSQRNRGQAKKKLDFSPPPRLMVPSLKGYCLACVKQCLGMSLRTVRCSIVSSVCFANELNFSRGKFRKWTLRAERLDPRPAPLLACGGQRGLRGRAGRRGVVRRTTPTTGTQCQLCRGARSPDRSSLSPCLCGAKSCSLGRCSGPCSPSGMTEWRAARSANGCRANRLPSEKTRARRHCAGWVSNRRPSAHCVASTTMLVM